MMSVSIHVDPSPVPAAADTIRHDMTWNGLVQLTGDLVVDSGVHLAIEDSSRIVVRAQADRFAAGQDSSRSEFIVRGTADVRGSEEGGVVFTSSRDPDFETWITNGEIGEDPAPGDWRGLRFQDTDPAAEASSLRDGDFDYAVFAVEVDSVGCTLYNNRFHHSSAADIWVPRDVRIPAAEAWWLEAPTRVVVNDHDPDSAGEDSSRVEVLVHGGLWTNRPAGAMPQDSVWFTPTGTSPTAGTWAGIAAEYWEAKGSIKDANIGYAVNPVRYTYLTNTATVQNSTLHHYTGIGILDEWSRASVIGNRLLGSGATSPDSGAVAGIKSIFSIPRIQDNSIAWHKEHGIKLEWTKAACLNASIEDSVLVTGNTVQGEGEDSGTFNHGTGIGVSWGCQKRHVRITNNLIVDWFERGIDLAQCADTRLECNVIQDNKIGVRHSRDQSQTESQPVRLRANDLYDNRDFNLWLDDASKLKLYSGYTGWPRENAFMPDSTGLTLHHNVRNVDLTTNVLDLQQSLWLSGSGDTLGTSPPFWVADHAYLMARVDSNAATVSITNPI